MSRQSVRQGSLLSLGLVLRGIVVDYVLVGSSAYKSKAIEPGDTVISVEGKMMPADGAVALSAEVGALVDVQIKKKNGEIRTVSLTRKNDAGDSGSRRGAPLNSRPLEPVSVTPPTSTTPTSTVKDGGNAVVVKTEIISHASESRVSLEVPFRRPLSLSPPPAARNQSSPVQQITNQELARAQTLLLEEEANSRNLKSKLFETQSEAVRLKSQIQDLELKMESAAQTRSPNVEAETLRDELSAYKHKIESLENTSQFEIRRLKNQLETARGAEEEVLRLRKQLEASQTGSSDEVAKLRRQLDASRQSEDEAVRLRRQIVTMENESQNLRQRVADLEKNLASSRVGEVHIGNDFDGAVSDIDKKIFDLNFAGGALGTSGKRAVEMAHQILDHERGSYKKHLGQLQDEINKYKQMLKTRERENGELESSLLSLQSEIEMLKNKEKSSADESRRSARRIAEMTTHIKTLEDICEHHKGQAAHLQTLCAHTMQARMRGQEFSIRFLADAALANSFENLVASLNKLQSESVEIFSNWENEKQKNLDLDRRLATAEKSLEIRTKEVSVAESAVKDLAEKLHLTNTQNTDFKLTVQNLNSKIGNLTEEREAAEKERETQFRNFHENIRNLQSRTAAAESQLEEMKEHTSKTETENSNLKKRLSESENNFKISSAQVKGLEGEIERLVSEFDRKTKIFQGKIKNLEEEIAKLKEICSERNQNLAHTAQILESTRETNQKLENDLAKERRAAEENRSVLENSVKSQKENFQRERQEMQSELSRENEVVSSLKLQIEKQRAATDRERESAHEHLTTAITENGILRGQFSEAQKEIDALLKEIEKLNEKINSVENSRTQIRTQSEQVISEWEIANLSLEKRISELEKDSDEKSAELEKQKHEFETERNATREKHSGEIGERKRECAEAFAREKNAEGRSDTLENSLRAEKTERERLEGLLTNANGEINLLQQNLAALESSLRTSETSLATADAEISGLRKEIDRLGGEIQKIQNDLRSERALSAELENDKIQMKNIFGVKISNLENLIKLTKIECEKMMDELEIQNSKLSQQLETNSKNFAEEIDAERNKNIELQEAVDQANETSLRTQINLDEAAREILRLKSQIEELTKENLKISTDFSICISKFDGVDLARQDALDSNFKIQRQLEESERQSGEQQQGLASLRKTVSILEQQIFDLKKSLSDLEENYKISLANLGEKNLSLIADLEKNLKISKDTYSQTLLELENKIKLKDAAAEDLRRRIEQLEAERHTLSAENGKIFSKFETCKEAMSETATKFKKSQKIISEKNVEISELNSMISELKVRLGDAEKNNDIVLSSQRQVELLNRDCLEAENRLHATEKKLGEKETESNLSLENFKIQIQERDTALALASDKIKNLEQSEADLQTVVENLRNENENIYKLEESLKNIEHELNFTKNFLESKDTQLGEAEREIQSLHDQLMAKKEPPPTQETRIGQDFSEEIEKLKEKIQILERERERDAEKAREREREIYLELETAREGLGEAKSRVGEMEKMLRQAQREAEYEKEQSHEKGTALAVQKMTVEKITMESAARVRRLELKIAEERRRSAETSELLEGTKNEFEILKERADHERIRMQKDFEIRLKFLEDQLAQTMGQLEGMRENTELQDREIERLQGVIRRQREAMAESDRAMSNNAMVHHWKSTVHEDEDNPDQPALV